MQRGWIQSGLLSASMLLHVGLLHSEMRVIGDVSMNGPVVSAGGSLSAIGPNLFAVTSSSGLHILSGETKLEDGAFVEWPDGSATAAAWNPKPSTFTHDANEYITDSSSWVSIPRSTVTLVMHGGRALVSYTCLGGRADFGLLVNGALIDGQTPTQGLVQATSISNVDMGVFTHLTEEKFSGSTKFSLVFKNQFSTVGTTANAWCQFLVAER